MATKERKKVIIGFSGYAGAGKDTFAKGLFKTLNHDYRVRGVKHRAFADAVRAQAGILNVYFPEYEKRYNEIIACVPGGYDNAKVLYPAIRAHLVDIGHGARTSLHEDIWVDKVLPPLWFVPHRSENTDFEVLIISDVRYLNEKDRIHEWGGIVVLIERDGVGPANETERKSIAELKPDLIVKNDGSIETAHKTALKIFLKHAGTVFEDMEK